MGDRLRKARELTGQDRQAFAETIGIHRDSLTKYETDKQPPKSPVVTAWALATGVDPKWLKTGAMEADSPTPGGAPGEGQRKLHLDNLHRTNVSSLFGTPLENAA